MGDRLSTEKYLEKHQLNELFEVLLAEVLVQKPPDPEQYIVAQLEKFKAGVGAKPLLDAGDLMTMFGMFDVTKRGVVTQLQASLALKTVLGSRAPNASSSEAAAAALGQQEFVTYMTTVLQKATPMCKAGQH